MSIYEQALNQWKQSRAQAAPRSGVMAVVQNALEDIFNQNVEPMAFGIQAQREADDERERELAMKQREQEREFELKQAREQQHADMEQARLKAVASEDSPMSNTMTMLQSRFESPEDLAAPMSDGAGDDFSSRFMAATGGGLQGLLDRVVPNAPPMFDEDFTMQGPSFRDLSAGYDENIAPNVPPIMNMAPRSLLNNLAWAEQGVDDLGGVLGPMAADVGGALYEMGRSALEPPAAAAARTAAPTAPAAPVAPIDPFAQGIDVPPGLGADIEGEMLGPPEMPMDFMAPPALATGEGEFSDFPLQEAFPLGSPGFDDAPLAGPLTQSDATVEGLLQEGGGSMPEGTGFMQMANGNVRTLDERKYKQRLKDVVAEAGDDPIAKALAATGIDPVSMTVIRPRGDGGFDETPLADTINQLSPVQRVALDQYENAQRALTAIDAENMGKTAIARASRESKPARTEIVDGPDGYKHIVNQDTGESVPLAQLGQKGVEIEYGKAGEEKRMTVSPKAAEAFTTLGITDPYDIEDYLFAPLDAKLLWKATNTKSVGDNGSKGARAALALKVINGGKFDDLQKIHNSLPEDKKKYTQALIDALEQYADGNVVSRPGTTSAVADFMGTPAAP